MCSMLTVGIRCWSMPRIAEMKVELPFKGETIWATQKQMSQMFDVGVANVSAHLVKIFKEGELQEDAVVKQDLITAADGVVPSSAQ